MSIPHLFRCPISLELFTDPVTLCTGQTYERSSIEKWLSAGNLTCPVTMQRLHDPSLVPNHTLRHLIDQWARMGLHLDPHCVHGTDPDPSLVLLRQNLESDQMTIASKIKTLKKVRALFEESPHIRSHFLQLGLLPLLLELIFVKSERRLSCDQLRFVEQGLACVLDLSALGGFEPLNMLKEGPRLASFQDLFEQGNNPVKVLMCKLVEMIALSSETNHLCCILGESLEILHEITLLLHGDDEEVSSAAIMAIQGLSSSEPNRENLVKEGAVEGIIEYILRAEKEMRSSGWTALAGSTLERLLKVEEGKEALLNHAQGVVTLVRNVFRVSSDQESSESAVNSLMIMCSGDYSSRARDEAIDAGVLSQVLLLLQSQCSSRTKTKARMLLHLLRS
ncbi:hypothetical protein CDL15_Pgr017381 [Punica granatum]|nr:hypothetical protein CDL15_Pgr017381 [Punica granatum]PKI79419.1 hypothetical protein CRG98_000166 [Punica granatum]